MSQCLTYFATADGAKWPTPGTMRGYYTKPGSCQGGNCSLIELPSTTHVLAGNETRIYHPQNFHYFIRTDGEGKVIPNSLIKTLKHPGGDCLVEYIKYVVTP